MKKAEDYYKELGQAGKVIEKDNAFRKEYVESMKRKPFPVKWVIIGVILSFGSLFYFRNNLINSATVQDLAKKHSDKKWVQSAVEITKKIAGSELPAAMPAPAKVEESSVTNSGVNRAVATAKSANDRTVEYVIIGGKYYKKTPDNVYNINGKRIYFVDNRSKQAARAPNTEGAAQDQTLSSGDAAVAEAAATAKDIKESQTMHEKMREAIVGQ